LRNDYSDPERCPFDYARLDVEKAAWVPVFAPFHFQKSTKDWIDPCMHGAVNACDKGKFELCAHSGQDVATHRYFTPATHALMTVRARWEKDPTLDPDYPDQYKRKEALDWTTKWEDEWRKNCIYCAGKWRRRKGGE